MEFGDNHSCPSFIVESTGINWSISARDDDHATEMKVCHKMIQKRTLSGARKPLKTPKKQALSTTIEGSTPRRPA